MTISFRHLRQGSSGSIEIAGSGIRAYDVLNYRREGDSPEEIAEAYSLPLAAVYEALAYACEHAEEMESIRTRDEQAYQKIMAGVPTELRDGGPLS